MSRNRSISTAAAMSIERTASAISTVTCLYSAGVVAIATGAAHSLQNREFGGSSVPHDAQTKAAAVISRGHPTVVHVTIVSPDRVDEYAFPLVFWVMRWPDAGYDERDRSARRW